MKAHLGAMNFGKRTSEADALAILERARELGITHLDTANAYTDGESERIVGRFAKPIRSEVTIATKCGFGRTAGKPEGLSKARIEAAIDESLTRLDTDYVDLYYLHVPDHTTPIEESMDALAGLLEKKKIRAWGVSNYAAWQVSEMNHLADARSMPRPAMAQHLYNVLVRQLDVEWIPFATKTKLHTTIYNPLAGGLLSGKHKKGDAIEKGSRFDKNAFYQKRYWTNAMFDRVAQLEEVAGGEGLTLLELAYAWAAGAKGVDSILLGPGTVQHLEAGVAAMEKTLSPDARAALDTLHRAWLGTDTYYVR